MIEDPIVERSDDIVEPTPQNVAMISGALLKRSANMNESLSVWV